MHPIRRFHPVLERNLRSFVSREDWKGMVGYLGTLSHSEFRTAGTVISDILLLEIEEKQFWTCFDVLYKQSPKAWLGTLLKAAIRRYVNDSLDFMQDAFLSLCRHMADHHLSIDQKKVLLAVLPVLKTPEEVTNLLSVLLPDDEERTFLFLVNCATMPCFFVLFQKMRALEGNRDQLVKCCNRLLERGDDRSFNLVSIVKHYFDLPEVKGVFSLRVQPYQLSRLDNSYQGFVQMMTSI